MIKESAIQKITVIKVAGQVTETYSDTLAIEEPLEIRIAFGTQPNRIRRNISVTMRTPGDDTELAIGFLFTEGVIKAKNEISEVSHSMAAAGDLHENIILIELNENVIPTLQNAERNFYTTSSCGVCGKGSIEAIRTTSVFNFKEKDYLKVSQGILLKLPGLLRDHQNIFDATGGLHACALFTPEGDFLQLREDVGRHNALDKLIGYALNEGLLPLENTVLLLSGRASFELIQKAAMAGIRMIAAVGAPSSLAVGLAAEFGITLVGFLRDSRFNIYTMPHRIVIPHYENKN